MFEINSVIVSCFHIKLNLKWQSNQLFDNAYQNGCVYQPLIFLWCRFFIPIRSIIIFINIMAYFVFCHINIPLFTQISIQINTIRIHQWTLCYWKAKAFKYNRSIRATFFFSYYFRKSEKVVSKKTISGENHRSTWSHWQHLSHEAITVHLTFHGDTTHNLRGNKPWLYSCKKI